MKFTLRQLEVYLATAHTENLSRAAQRLSLSQSAASDALRSLEHQFGVQLFDRVGKRLKLNALGQQLRPQCEQFLQQAKELERSFQQNETVAGELTIGATLSIGNYPAIRLVAEFRRRYPAVRVRLEVANTQQVIALLRNFEIDIGMVEGEVNHPELLGETWTDDELLLFSSPDHPVAGAILDDEDLLQQEWILRESGSGTRQAFDVAMRGLLPELHIGMELQHTEAIKRAVEAGLGIGCLSSLTLEDTIARGSVVQVFAPQRNFRRKLYLVTHRQKFKTLALQRWVELCREYR